MNERHAFFLLHNHLAGWASPPTLGLRQLIHGPNVIRILPLLYSRTRVRHSGIRQHPQTQTWNSAHVMSNEEDGQRERRSGGERR